MHTQRMFRLALAILLCAAAITSTSCSNSPSPSASNVLPESMSAAAPLVDAIVAAVPGLSQAQAMLGAGAVLGVAKNDMPADQYSQVANAVPGTEALVANALKAGLPSTAKSLTDASAFLNKNGISNEQMKQLADAVGGAMRSKVPGQVADAFATAVQ